MSQDYREIIRVIYDHSQTSEEGDAVVAALTVVRHYREATVRPIDLQLEFGMVLWRISSSGNDPGRDHITLANHGRVIGQWSFP